MPAPNPLTESTAVAWVGVGANLGRPQDNIRAAAAALAAREGVHSLRMSSLYRSAPVDATGPDYFNAVLRVETSLAPLALLEVLQSLEHAFGRQRLFHHAPRTLDLDLLAQGAVTLSTERLTLPHPRLHLRAFVLLPWLELCPDAEVLGVGRLVTFLPSVSDQLIARVAD